jgi:hypothetical protein
MINYEIIVIWKGCGRNWSWSISRYCLSIFLEVLCQTSQHFLLSGSGFLRPLHISTLEGNNYFPVFIPRSFSSFPLTFLHLCHLFYPCSFAFSFIFHPLVISPPSFLPSFPPSFLLLHYAKICYLNIAHYVPLQDNNNETSYSRYVLRYFYVSSELRGLNAYKKA